MEDPDYLLQRVLDFARDSDVIQAVVLTGSRGRDSGVDQFSDLDVEFIFTSNDVASNPLSGSDAWLAAIGPVLVCLHLRNGGEGEPDWPTCLVVFEGGRKIDFTLAGPLRVERMQTKGPDGTYTRGFKVLLDKTGITTGLEVHTPTVPPTRLPSADEIEAHQREFWFEATQVPIYVARNDLWPAQLRLAELREQLLIMLQWMLHAPTRLPGYTSSIPRDTEGTKPVVDDAQVNDSPVINTEVVNTAAIDTWHNGHHLSAWLPEPYASSIPSTFALYTRQSIHTALIETIELYALASDETCNKLGFSKLDLKDPALRHIESVLSSDVAAPRTH